MADVPAVDCRGVMRVSFEIRPSLTRVEVGDLAYWTDCDLLRGAGVCICFSERAGGVSAPPFASLNLAAHVGDDPDAVDENRLRLLRALGLEGLARDLTMAEQVHGSTVRVIDTARAGQGSRAGASPGPVPGCDALVTRSAAVPLLLCFADCVPVILVAPGPAVAVVHSGWRGAAASIAARAALVLAEEAGCETSSIAAYVGAHIGPCHYPVGDEVLSHFREGFDRVAQAQSGGLDLGAVVAESLTLAGVDPCNIVRLGACTAETTDRFFSHRAEAGLTGRHGALACILPLSS